MNLLVMSTAYGQLGRQGFCPVLNSDWVTHGPLTEEPLMIVLHATIAIVAVIGVR